MPRFAVVCLLAFGGLAMCIGYPYWPAAQSGAPGQGCTDPEFRQLDFRLGRFQVTTIGGEAAGESHVESVLGGCLLVEHWRGAISGYGRSHLFYDKGDGLWRLVYVTDEGKTLYFTGNFEGDTLVLTGDNEFDAYNGLHRMSFSPLPEGGTRQLWEFSVDDGAMWQVVHEAVYARRKTK